MRVLFCNIAWMKYYKGTWAGDIPVNGGSYVHKNQAANEDLNFLAIPDDNDVYVCYGSVETKSTTGSKVNELHIEKIEGCQALKNEPLVEDVLVVFCAKPDRPDAWTCVVGWYKHATVYRNYQVVTLRTDDGEEERSFNIEALKENAVLLPTSLRTRRTLWWAPRAKLQGYGFGQANVWFPTNAEGAERNYLTKLIKQIDEYCGENWLDKFE